MLKAIRIFTLYSYSSAQISQPLETKKSALPKEAEALLTESESMA